MRRGQNAVAAELIEYIFAGTLKKISDDVLGSKNDDNAGKSGSQHSSMMSRQNSVSWSDWKESRSNSKSASYDSTDNIIIESTLDSQEQHNDLTTSLDNRLNESSYVPVLDCNSPEFANSEQKDDIRVESL